MQQGTTAPVWLRDEPELTGLLHTVLDRFDRLPASTRQRAMSLPAEQQLPILAQMGVDADHLWSLVRELERHGVLSIRRARRGPFDADWQGAKLAFSAAGEPTIREWLQRERVTPELTIWREAVHEHAAAFPGGCDALLARRIVIEGCSNEEVVAGFARIASLRGPLTLRQLSTLAFFGDSKVLDDRRELIAALFPQLEIRDRALVVAVSLPPACDGVLFIENQDTYTAACRGGLAELAASLAGLTLVFAAGFRGAAERVRARDGAILHYAEATQATQQRRFDAWWFDHGEPLGPCWFWGDLDFAGMQILRSLRQRFGEVRAWQPGFAPMLAGLCTGGGRTGNRRGQVDPGTTGCSYADEQLLPAIREHGMLDQELPVALRTR